MNEAYEVQVSEIDLKRAAKAFVGLMDKNGAKRDPKRAYFLSMSAMFTMMVGPLKELSGEEEARSILHQCIDNAFEIHANPDFKSPWTR